jgi:hypothetical protein
LCVCKCADNNEINKLEAVVVSSSRSQVTILYGKPFNSDAVRET